MCVLRKIYLIYLSIISFCQIFLNFPGYNDISTLIKIVENSWKFVSCQVNILNEFEQRLQTNFSPQCLNRKHAKRESWKINRQQCLTENTFLKYHTCNVWEWGVGWNIWDWRIECPFKRILAKWMRLLILNNHVS